MSIQCHLRTELFAFFDTPQSVLAISKLSETIFFEQCVRGMFKLWQWLGGQAETSRVRGTESSRRALTVAHFGKQLVVTRVEQPANMWLNGWVRRVLGLLLARSARWGSMVWLGCRVETRIADRWLAQRNLAKLARCFYWHCRRMRRTWQRLFIYIRNNTERNCNWFSPDR